jgi:hypothetical protein
VVVDQASGLRTPAYRLGIETGLTEMRNLLALGDPGKAVIQAEVTRERVLRLYAQPAAAEYTVSRDNLSGLWPGAAWRVSAMAGRIARVNLEGFGPSGASRGGGPGITSPGTNILKISRLEMDGYEHIRLLPSE